MHNPRNDKVAKTLITQWLRLGENAKFYVRHPTTKVETEVLLLDLIKLASLGSSQAEVDGVLDLSAVGAVRKIAKIPFGATELGGSETNTSFTFPAGGAILHGAWWQVTDGEAGTMDVGTQGTSNDPDGILDGVDLTNIGIFTPNAVTTTGLNETYISAMTFGALSHRIFVGSDEAGEKGSILTRPQFITALDPVSITSSGDLNSCSGFVFLDYTELLAA
jgi:hypothetical protein